MKYSIPKKVIIMDDEKYFSVSTTHNKGCYSADKNTCPDGVRFFGKENFPIKVLMLIEISERGMSETYFIESKSESIDKNVNIKECLQKRLLPFIFIIWPN